MMTKKDFKIIAKTINLWQAGVKNKKNMRKKEMIDSLINTMSDALQEQNERFNKTVFFNACKMSLKEERRPWWFMIKCQN